MTRSGTQSQLHVLRALGAVLVGAATLAAVSSVGAAPSPDESPPAAREALVPHLSLVRAEPARDTTVAEAPKELKLHFSEAVRPQLAAVRLLHSDSSAVTVGSLSVGAALSRGYPPLVVPITGEMRPGRYTVMWRVTGADSHTITGTYGFRVRAAEGGSR